MLTHARRRAFVLYGLLQARGLSLPAATTILENVNLVSQATRVLIFDKQIARVLGEDLDDFKRLTIKDGFESETERLWDGCDSKQPSDRTLGRKSYPNRYATCLLGCFSA